MKNKRLLLIALILSFVFSDDRKIIAVADISTDGLSEVQKNILFNKIETELVNLKKYSVTTRTEVEKILKEQKFQQSGCVNQQCAADIGKMLSADQMLMVSIIFDKESQYISTTLRLVDVEEAVIVTAITKDKENVRNVTSIFSDISEYILELYRLDNAQVSIAPAPSGAVQDGIGSVRIITDPPVVNVIIDSKEYGTSPLNVDLPEGKHRLNLTKNKYERKTEIFNVLADSLLELSYTLSRQTGNLMIITKPKEAKVYLNDKYYGTTPLDLKYLEIGEYEISIRKRDYKEFIDNITVNLNTDKIIDKNLASIPATVAFFSSPSGATVLLDGEAKGKTQERGLILDLDAGKYNLEMRLKGHYPSNQEIELISSEAIDFDLTLSPLPLGVSDNPNNGWIFFKSTPRSSSIKIKDSYFSSPVKYHELGYGDYPYIVSEYGYKTKRGKFTIEKERIARENIELVKHNHKKAKAMSYLFPGLGHMSVEEPGKGFLWLAGGLITAAICKELADDYKDKDFRYEQALLEEQGLSDPFYLNGYTIGYYDDARNLQRDEFGYSLLALGAYWIWNIYDLNKIFDKHNKVYIRVSQDEARLEYGF